LLYYILPLNLESYEFELIEGKIVTLKTFVGIIEDELVPILNLFIK